MRTSAKVTVGTSTGRGSRGLAESTTWDRNYVRSVVAEAFEGQGLRRASDKASATQLEAILSACIGKSPTGDQVSGFEAACGNSEETSYGRVAVADALQACSATHLQGCSVRSNKDRLFEERHGKESHLQWLRSMRWSTRLFTASNMLLFPVSALLLAVSIGNAASTDIYPESIGLAAASALVFLNAILGIVAMCRLRADLTRDDDVAWRKSNPRSSTCPAA